MRELGPDFAAEDECGRILPQEATPLRRAARGETFAMTFVVTDVSGNRRLFQAEGCPVHTQEAGDSMLVIHEITDRAPRRVFDVPKQPATSEGLTDTAWHAN